MAESAAPIPVIVWQYSSLGPYGIFYPLCALLFPDCLSRKAQALWVLVVPDWLADSHAGHWAFDDRCGGK